MFFLFNSILFVNLLTFNLFGVHFKNNPVLFIELYLRLILNSIFFADDFIFLLFFIQFLLLSSFFVPFIDELGLPLLEEVEEVVYWEEDSQEKKYNVTTCVEFCLEVADTGLDHDESPREGEGQDKVNDMTKYHIPPVLPYNTPQRVSLLEIGYQPGK